MKKRCWEEKRIERKDERVEKERVVIEECDEEKVLEGENNKESEKKKSEKEKK